MSERKIIVGAMVSMDGVMQAPGGPWPAGLHQSPPWPAVHHDVRLL